MLVSEQSAIAQSESAYSSLIAGLNESGKLSKDTKLIARVQEITNRLITQAVKYRPETKDWKWSVEVIDDPETVNAFCMAGGKMAIMGTSGASAPPGCVTSSTAPVGEGQWWRRCWGRSSMGC